MEQQETYTKLIDMLYNNRKSFVSFLQSAIEQGFYVDYTPSANDLTLLETIYDEEFPEQYRIACERFAIPQNLIKSGANVNWLDKGGLNILKQAINVMARPQIVKMIIERTEDINQEHYNRGFGKRTAFGTAAINFIYNGNAKEYTYYYNICKMLLDAGADPYRDHEWQNLPTSTLKSHVKNTKETLNKLISDVMKEKIRPDMSSKGSSFDYEL